jgi:lysophospholipid acyltransferase (LPLAT)-like uncharacterized protein
MIMKRIQIWIISRLYWFAISLLYKTVRIQPVGEDRVSQLVSQGKRILFCFFHGDYLLLFPRFGSKEICIFTTQSRRGELLAEIIRLFGYTPYTIPDKRGHHLALDPMIEEIQKGYHSVMAVDGPLGPYHKVKHGIIIMAQQTGNPIIPLGIASSWRIVLKKRWDHYTIPIPFSRAALIFGEQINVPEDLDEDGIESFRLKVEGDLVRLNREAEDCLHDGRQNPHKPLSS